MRTIPRCLMLALTLGWLAGGPGAARAQTTVYSAYQKPDYPQTGVVHFLQVVTLAQGPGTYTVSTLTFSANFPTGSSQEVLFSFYSGVDTDPNSTNALAHAKLFAITQGDLTSPGPGNFAFTYSPSSLTFTTDSGGSIAIEVEILSPDGSAFATMANGRFTPTLPTAGSAAGYVWNDADLNSIFTGAEQTRFGLDNANIRLSMAGTLTQPAPVLKTYARSGTTATLTVDSYGGVNYQLQRATSLTAGDWTNVGDPAAGATGTVLTFTDRDATDPTAFYRVLASVPGSGARPAVSRAVARKL